MNREIVWTTKFKKDYKLAIKRHLDIGLLDDILVLTLARTGTHSDIFGKRDTAVRETKSFECNCTIVKDVFE